MEINFCQSSKAEVDRPFFLDTPETRGPNSIPVTLGISYYFVLLYNKFI